MSGYRVPDLGSIADLRAFHLQTEGRGQDACQRVADHGDGLRGMGHHADRSTLPTAEVGLRAGYVRRRFGRSATRSRDRRDGAADRDGGAGDADGAGGLAAARGRAARRGRRVPHRYRGGPTESAVAPSCPIAAARGRPVEGGGSVHASGPARGRVRDAARVGVRGGHDRGPARSRVCSRRSVREPLAARSAGGAIGRYGGGALWSGTGTGRYGVSRTPRDPTRDLGGRRHRAARAQAATRYGVTTGESRRPSRARDSGAPRWEWGWRGIAGVPRAGVVHTALPD